MKEVDFVLGNTFLKSSWEGILEINKHTLRSHSAKYTKAHMAETNSMFCVLIERIV